MGSLAGSSQPILVRREYKSSGATAVLPTDRSVYSTVVVTYRNIHVFVLSQVAHCNVEGHE